MKKFNKRCKNYRNLVKMTVFLRNLIIHYSKSKIIIKAKIKCKHNSKIFHFLTKIKIIKIKNKNNNFINSNGFNNHNFNQTTSLKI